MSIALDAKEVEPQTTFLYDGPLKNDEFEIKNSDGKYRGKTSMSETLAFSMNTGMSFVAKKLGKKLMYQYLKQVMIFHGVLQYSSLVFLWLLCLA